MAFAASSCRRAASLASPAVTWLGYVGLVALNLTGRLPSVKRSRSRPYSPCNHTTRRKCSHVWRPAVGTQEDRVYPCLIQEMEGSGGFTGGLCWQSHQLPPGHSS
jgi:hypothetical protein